MPVRQDVHDLSLDAPVSLYILDTTPIGGNDIFRFTTMPNADGSKVSFDGMEYTPIDMEVTGFKWDGGGAFPTPRVTIANIDGIMTSMILNFGDLVGSKFVRIRTFARHLDNGSDPDPLSIFPLEVYTVNQRTEHNSVFVEYELRSILDQQGVKLPRRQVIRDTCTHRYRRWDPDAQAFDYSDATCPYKGTNNFDKHGAGTTADKDDCGRKLADCKKRFGQNATLPTRSFPGAGKNGA